MVRLPRSYWRSRLPTNLGRLVAADSADRVADEQADLLVLLWRAGGCPGNGGGNCAGFNNGGSGSRGDADELEREVGAAGKSAELRGHLLKERCAKDAFA